MKKMKTKIAAALLFASASVLAGYPPDAIFDEAKVPPYTLPDPLVCQDGTRVTDAQTWREKRRPELLRLFESEEYGKTLLGKPEAMRFVVREEKKDALGGKATRLRVGVLFEGKEDGRQMEMLVYLPNNATEPVPVFLGLNFDGNYSTTDEPDIPLPKHFAYGLYANKLVDRIVNRAIEAKAAGQPVRKDDDPEVFKSRLAAYERDTAAVTPFYRAAGLLHAVDGMAPIDSVTTAIDAVLKAVSAA